MKRPYIKFDFTQRLADAFELWLEVHQFPLQRHRIIYEGEKVLLTSVKNLPVNILKHPGSWR